MFEYQELCRNDRIAVQLQNGRLAARRWFCWAPVILIVFGVYMTPALAARRNESRQIQQARQIMTSRLPWLEKWRPDLVTASVASPLVRQAIILRGKQFRIPESQQPRGGDITYLEHVRRDQALLNFFRHLVVPVRNEEERAQLELHIGAALHREQKNRQAYDESTWIDLSGTPVQLRGDRDLDNPPATLRSVPMSVVLMTMLRSDQNALDATSAVERAAINLLRRFEWLDFVENEMIFDRILLSPHAVSAINSMGIDRSRPTFRPGPKIQQITPQQRREHAASLLSFPHQLIRSDPETEAQVARGLLVTLHNTFFPLDMKLNASAALVGHAEPAPSTGFRIGPALMHLIEEPLPVDHIIAYQASLPPGMRGSDDIPLDPFSGFGKRLRHYEGPRLGLSERPEDFRAVVMQLPILDSPETQPVVLQDDDGSQRVIPAPMIERLYLGLRDREHVSEISVYQKEDTWNIGYKGPLKLLTEVARMSAVDLSAVLEILEGGSSSAGMLVIRASDTDRERRIGKLLFDESTSSKQEEDAVVKMFANAKVSASLERGEQLTAGKASAMHIFLEADLSDEDIERLVAEAAKHNARILLDRDDDVWRIQNHFNLVDGNQQPELIERLTRGLAAQFSGFVVPLEGNQHGFFAYNFLRAEEMQDFFRAEGFDYLSPVEHIITTREHARHLAENDGYENVDFAYALHPDTDASEVAGIMQTALNNHDVVIEEGSPAEVVESFARGNWAEDRVLAKVHSDMVYGGVGLYVVERPNQPEAEEPISRLEAEIHDAIADEGIPGAYGYLGARGRQVTIEELQQQIPAIQRVLARFADREAEFGENPAAFRLFRSLENALTLRQNLLDQLRTHAVIREAEQRRANLADVVARATAARDSSQEISDADRRVLDEFLGWHRQQRQLYAPRQPQSRQSQPQQAEQTADNTSSADAPLASVTHGQLVAQILGSGGGRGVVLRYLEDDLHLAQLIGSVRLALGLPLRSRFGGNHAKVPVHSPGSFVLQLASLSAQALGIPLDEREPFLAAANQTIRELSAFVIEVQDREATELPNPNTSRRARKEEQAYNADGTHAVTDEPVRMYPWAVERLTQLINEHLAGVDGEERRIRMQPGRIVPMMSTQAPSVTQRPAIAE